MPQRVTALQWLGWEYFELPPEAVAGMSEDDNMAYAKAILVCAAGDGSVTEAERAWITGYLSTVGVPDEVVDAVRTYDGADAIETLLATTPNMPVYRRSMIYDAFRACASDGELSAAELATIRAAADRLVVAPQIVDELEQVVRQDEALRKRRHKLIVADSFADAVA